MARLPGPPRLTGLPRICLWIVTSGLLGLLAGAVSRWPECRLELAGLYRCAGCDFFRELRKLHVHVLQVLQTLYGCSSSSAGAAASVCERRLVQLDAARVAGADAGQRIERQHEQNVQPVLVQQPQRQAQQQALQQPEQAAAAEAPAAGRLVPDGYELPEECAKHEPLYSGIFDSLRPWYERGVTREDMDACLPVAPAGHDVAAG